MRLVTLGGLRLEDSDFTRPKPLLLLCYLTIEGSRSRRVLADLFFPNVKDPRDSLSTALPYLRGLGEDVLAAERSRLTASVACDAVDVMAHLDAGRLDSAAELYRGPLLADLDLELGEELEEWVFATREYFAAHMRRAHLARGETAVARGEFAQAASLAERAYAVREAQLGPPAEIERTYAMLIAGQSPRAKHLPEQAAEYGVALEATPEEARARLSGASAGAEPIGSNNLVQPGTSFVGRERELDELAGHLMDSQRRLVIVGIPAQPCSSTRALRWMPILKRVRGYDVLQLGERVNGHWHAASEAVRDLRETFGCPGTRELATIQALQVGPVALTCNRDARPS